MCNKHLIPMWRCRHARKRERCPDVRFERVSPGDEPMTDAQLAPLGALLVEAGLEFNRTLTGASASKFIERIRGVSPRTAG